MIHYQIDLTKTSGIISVDKYGTIKESTPDIKWMKGKYIGEIFDFVEKRNGKIERLKEN